MSAQDTVLEHFFSKLALISSMISIHLRVLLASAYISVLFCALSNRIEASHPYKLNNNFVSCYPVCERERDVKALTYDIILTKFMRLNQVLLDCKYFST